MIFIHIKLSIVQVSCLLIMLVMQIFIFWSVFWYSKPHNEKETN
jgi:hypothetical protein